jgi:hypothetical protein
MESRRAAEEQELQKVISILTELVLFTKLSGAGR